MKQQKVTKICIDGMVVDICDGVVSSYFHFH
jgi:hypothetical protein